MQQTRSQGPAQYSAQYSMLIEWDPSDRIYVVAVPELPGCRTHGVSYEDAVRRGQEAVESWVQAAQADGQSVPPPRFAADAA